MVAPLVNSCLGPKRDDWVWVYDMVILQVFSAKKGALIDVFYLKYFPPKISSLPK